MRVITPKSSSYGNNNSNFSSNSNMRRSFIREKFLRSSRLKTRHAQVGGKTKIVDLPKGFAPSIKKTCSHTVGTTSVTLSTTSSTKNAPETPVTYCQRESSIGEDHRKGKSKAYNIAEYENVLDRNFVTSNGKLTQVGRSTVIDRRHDADEERYASEDEFNRFDLKNESEEYLQVQTYYSREDRPYEIYPNSMDFPSGSTLSDSQGADWTDARRDISLFDSLSMNNGASSVGEEDDELQNMRLQTQQYQSELQYLENGGQGSLFSSQRRPSPCENSALPRLGERVGESYCQFNNNSSISSPPILSISEIFVNMFSPPKQPAYSDYTANSKDPNSKVLDSPSKKESSFWSSIMSCGEGYGTSP